MKKEIAVNITQQAVDKAKELVSLDSSSIGLRIEIKKGGCSGMTYDVVHAKSFNEQDEVIKKDGVTFVIDPSAILFIIGSTIDWKEDKFKRGFSFENPNAPDSLKQFEEKPEIKINVDINTKPLKDHGDSIYEVDLIIKATTSIKKKIYF